MKFYCLVEVLPVSLAILANAPHNHIGPLLRTQEQNSLGFQIGLTSLGCFVKLLKNPPKHETSKKTSVTQGMEQGRIIKRLVTNAHFRHFLPLPLVCRINESFSSLDHLFYMCAQELTFPLPLTTTCYFFKTTHGRKYFPFKTNGLREKALQRSFKHGVH